MISSFGFDDYDINLIDILIAPLDFLPQIYKSINLNIVL